MRRCRHRAENRRNCTASGRVKGALFPLWRESEKAFYLGIVVDAESRVCDKSQSVAWSRAVTELTHKLSESKNIAGGNRIPLGPLSFYLFLA